MSSVNMIVKHYGIDRDVAQHWEDHGSTPDEMILKGEALHRMQADSLVGGNAMLVREMIKACKFTHAGREYVWVYCWGRDCDQCESSHIEKIQASEHAWYSHEAMVYDNAEGPVSVFMITPEDAADFEPTFRDHAAEQMGY